ncbi:MAG: hypothetical protein Q4Q20_05145 [Methanocorpusculum sp.]|nr:hypothetical protein [Methanocorpusculum sp.]
METKYYTSVFGIVVAPVDDTTGSHKVLGHGYSGIARPHCRTRYSSGLRPRKKVTSDK